MCAVGPGGELVTCPPHHHQHQTTFDNFPYFLVLRLFWSRNPPQCVFVKKLLKCSVSASKRQNFTWLEHEFGIRFQHASVYPPHWPPPPRLRVIWMNTQSGELAASFCKGGEIVFSKWCSLLAVMGFFRDTISAGVGDALVRTFHAEHLRSYSVRNVFFLPRSCWHPLICDALVVCHFCNCKNGAWSGLCMIK